MLLENVYVAFDEIASRRGVYKVETVGDCYVAVTGLPQPRKDHAVVMARYARDIIHRMSLVTKELEKTLGPGTDELSLRVGIHSGPVTAGVLRGERARFQLFGDTVNTCARLESSCTAGNVQLSKDTADLLMKAGKKEWFYPRDEKVHAKGKGELETFFLYLHLPSISRDQRSSMARSDRTLSLDGGIHLDETETIPKDLGDHYSRLIDWNVKKLADILRQIIAKQDALIIPWEKCSVPQLPGDYRIGSNPLDEVREIITLPSFDRSTARQRRNADDVVVPEDVMEQLVDYVTCIASMYRPNPFHNFDHASHVVMSVTKLLSRIVAPTELPLGGWTIMKTGQPPPLCTITRTGLHPIR